MKVFPSDTKESKTCLLPEGEHAFPVAPFRRSLFFYFFVSVPFELCPSTFQGDRIDLCTSFSCFVCTSFNLEIPHGKPQRHQLLVATSSRQVGLLLLE